jgi:DHA1 family tetracycline resistance protein-like MFS transporter
VLGFASSLPMLFLGRALDGATAGNLGIAQALITDVTRPEERTRAFGIIGIAFGIGFLFGPAASGWLATHHGLGAPPLVAAGFSALSILLTATLVKEPVRAPTAPREGGRMAALTSFFRAAAPRARLLELFCYAFAFSQLTGGLALFLLRRLGYGVEQTGYVFAFSGLVGGLAQGGIGRVARRLGEARLARTGFVLMTLGYAGLALVFDLPALLLAAGVASLGAAITRPAVTTLLTQAVEPSDHGAALGVSQSMTSLAQVGGPLLAGALLHAGWPSAWALSAAASASLGLLAGASATARPVNAPVAGAG